MANEISVSYHLPEHWEQAENLSFDQLSSAITELHSSAQNSAVKAINRFATVRNYIIGFYIVEYEQHGSDRAKYGDRLIKRLAEKINRRGLNETLLKTSRAFYLNYPQIGKYLNLKSATVSHLSKISATSSHLSDEISPTASDLFIANSPTTSDFSELVATTIADAFKFETDAEKLISKLSFSHIREIMTVDDRLARFFYETECIKCCWSVQELRRQIATNLFFRSGISKNPQKLLEPTKAQDGFALTIKDPFSFEFLDLRPEAFSESDLENALISHLQDFLLELGKGFCFEARQKRMVIDDEYYFADLVFYNRILHCNVIVELKNDEFKHADLSQLNAYVSYFKENEMHEGDNPPVGILLCTKKGKKMVEYALAGLDNTLFVSTYMLTLPDTKTLEEFLLRETRQMR